MATSSKRPRAKSTAPRRGDALRGPRTGPSRQATLFRDRMPDRVEPCLATLVPEVPTAEHWSYEIKWDGFRLHVHVEASGVRILTRGGHDWTHRFAAIAKAAAELGVATAIIDGEAVVLDERGRSEFAALQQALGGRGGKRVASEALFYAFDLMFSTAATCERYRCTSVGPPCARSSRTLIHTALSGFPKTSTRTVATFSSTSAHSAWKA